MALPDDLERIAGLAAEHGPPGAAVAAVIAAEPAAGARVYVCAFSEGDGAARSWLVLDDAGAPVTRRRDVRDAVSIAALCEIAEESAAGGDLDELLAQLVAVRVTEAPEGVEEAETAVRSLQHVLAAPPQLASPRRLDEIGGAARQLELALDPTAGSPFAIAMKGAQAVVEELLAEVESSYRAEIG
jgi:hypothetical protein